MKERVHVRNADSYMNTLRRGEHFGLIGENYSRREGAFKLFDLPVGVRRSGVCDCSIQETASAGGCVGEVGR